MKEGVFDSCSSFFAPKPHRNACYAGYKYTPRYFHSRRRCCSLPADVLWGSFVTHSMNAWQTNPKGRLRGGYRCCCSLVNPLIKTALFGFRSPERFKASSTNPQKKNVRILVDKGLNCNDLLCIYFFSLRIKYMTFIYSSLQKYIHIPFPVFPATSLILSLLYLVINAYKSDLDVGQYQIKLSIWSPGDVTHFLEHCISPLQQEPGHLAISYKNSLPPI